MKRCHKYAEDIRHTIMTFDFECKGLVILEELVSLLNMDAQLIFRISGGSGSIDIKGDDYVVSRWINSCFSR